MLNSAHWEDREAFKARLASALAEQIYGLAVVARCLLPFLPQAAADLHNRLGLEVPERYSDPLTVAGLTTASEAVLFPRRQPI
jgi:methionyl-tRNA synthetase